MFFKSYSIMLPMHVSLSTSCLLDEGACILDCHINGCIRGLVVMGSLCYLSPKVLYEGADAIELSEPPLTLDVGTKCVSIAQVGPILKNIQMMLQLDGGNMKIRYKLRRSQPS
ncbi:uncharacterized protein LOC105165729 [Sesamum indicum]|uniref:Uncharacterized protein LOC105165729 n=1 Tax=Sesamum indicum TaxID=4182 RepID=A0A8M8UTY5_SESIN|nr:uncharacterized protein LOC105165729 [Sesamum indicum]